MKNNDNHFETQVVSAIACPLHPKLKTLYSTAFPSKVDHLRNLIFYGPQGTGKYSQVLACISRYSPTHLKYEKRLTISFNKEPYFIKISDIHFEIDMSLLGCNSKLLWNEMHNQIVDVISARADSVGIIVCKYFHSIHSELLETFYSYMHMPHQGGTNPIRLKYILITEHIGFIPTIILNSCEVIPVARPTAAMYKKIIAASPLMKIIPENVTNIKMLQNQDADAANSNANANANADDATTSNHELFQNLCKYVVDIPQIRYMKLRELLYDILIYDFDITECAWHLITDLKRTNALRDEDMSEVLINTCKFLQYYNNNYRPIYHLENFTFMLINLICANKNKSNQ